ncbi:heterokaryon incompatibility protein-domain-containing protein [Podospora fimiseda]|uniref:Heterokaryon incompatibility protein-domain-containing protein n=1 Tax=Podospora fimiseda TaxID=252190 RepID=A0AAN7BIT7_9PEZI|nr:heterokaryon incompatibility protein-domain-containing protein [Podospora fimiseda]
MAYPYRPLDLPRETRILIIQPSEEKDDDIICSLEHMNIETESGKYHALSYCWSKSVSNPPAGWIEKTIVFNFKTKSGTDRQELKPRDLLGHPGLEYLYIRYGGVLPPATIVCDGVQMQVGGELFRALKHLRAFFSPSKTPFRLWVDALSINQDNLDERNEHVKLMGKIYASAAAVQIWLGDSIGVESEVGKACKLIEYILEDTYKPERSRWHEDSGEPFTADDPRWKGVNWGALSQFLGRAWFSRIWVVQEIINAKEAWMHVSNVVIKWDFFAEILDWMRRLGLEFYLSHPSSVKALVIMGAFRQEKKNGQFRKHDLACVLDEIRGFQATIASDKVYGALGLFSDSLSETEFIQVDYAKSTEDVFTDIAVDYLQRRNSLAILSHCVLSTRPRNSPPFNLPSWVPDWTAPGWADSFRTRMVPYKASGNTVPDILEVNKVTGILRLRGHRLDTVRAVDHTGQIPELQFSFPEQPSETHERHPVFLSLASANDKKEEFGKLEVLQEQELANIFLLAITNSCSDEESETFIWNSVKHENLWRTYMCNRTRGFHIPDKTLETAWNIFLQKSLRFMDRYVRLGEGETADAKMMSNRRPSTHELFAGAIKDDIGRFSQQELLDKAQRLKRGHRTWTYHRRFFVSSNGRFGWAVDGTKPGDELVMFYGSDYPFIVRRDEETRRLRIIGDCYIHGLMNGEGLGSEFEECGFVLV